MPTADEIKAAAAPDVVDKVPPGTIGQDGKPVGRKVYPSPMKYEGNPFAEKVNGMLNEVDPAKADTFLAEPASKLMVGECAMATLDAWGLDADAEETPIHPGWLLLLAFVAYVVVVGLHYWMAPKEAAKPAAKGEDLASLA